MWWISNFPKSGQAMVSGGQKSPSGVWGMPRYGVSAEATREIMTQF